MKILDEKGKLFGIINIFDLLILFVIIPFIFFVVKWSRIAEDPSWIRVKTFFTPCITKAIVPRYIADLIKEGDEMLNEDGVVVARIARIISNELAYKPKPKIYLSKDGEKIAIKPSVIVVSSKDGEKVFRWLKPEAKIEPEFNKEEREITLLIDILSYERKGEAYSCISTQPLRIRTGLTMNVYKKAYFIDFRIYKVLISKKKPAGENIIDREL